MNSPGSSNNWHSVGLQAIRAPFLSAAIVAVLVGSAVAYHDGTYRWNVFIITLVAAVAIHAGANVWNDYFDHLFKADDYNTQPTPFSGGSRVIQEGKMTPGAVLWLAIACYAVSIAACIWLVKLSGWPLLVFGLVGLFLAVEYSAPPLRLSYRGHGLGELATGIGFGPMMVMGTYFAQTGTVRPHVVWASLPIGFLIAAVLWINEFPDYESDRRVGKQTMVVVQGPRFAVAGYVAMVLAAYVSVIVGGLAGLMPWTALVTFLTLPMAIRAVLLTRLYFNEVDRLLPANALTIQVHSLFGVALATSFLLARLIRLWF